MNTDKSQLFVIVAGGTGGHIFPAIATGRAIANIHGNCRIIYLCGTRPLEMELYKNAGIEPLTMSSKHFGNSIAAFVSGLFSTLLNLFRCLILFHIRKPSAVVGFGGYVTGPALLAAYFLRIPRAIHESNAVIGKTNKWLLGVVDLYAVNYLSAASNIKKSQCVIKQVLMPIQNFKHFDKQEALSFFNFSNNRKTLLVIGGSQGAQAMYEQLACIFQKLQSDPISDSWQILWSTGKNNYDWLSNRFPQTQAEQQESGLSVKLVPFISRMDFALCVADAAISRAGASTLAELTTAGIKPLLIPLPTAIYNHQELNAQILASDDSAVCLLQSQLFDTEDAFNTIINYLNTSNEIHSTQKYDCSDAADNFAKEIINLANAR